MPIFSFRIGLALFFLSCFIHTTTLQAKVTAALSIKVYEKLKQAQQLLDKSQYLSALKTLNKLKSKNLTPYERSQLVNLIAYSHYLNNNYAAASDHYEKLLTMPELTQALLQNTLKTLSQLSLLNENYQRAITLSKRLLKLLPSPDRNTLMLLGQAHYQLKQYQQASKPVTQAIHLTQQLQQIPRENDWLLLSAIHHHLKQYPQMTKVLEQLILHYPRISYIKNLAAVYGELKQSNKQLGLYEALYDSGQLSHETELKNLASLYMHHNLPYKAAKLLEKNLDDQQLKANASNYKLVAQAWIQAGEQQKAILPMEKAAKLSGDYNLYLQLGYSHFRLGQWQMAEKALNHAVKGKLKDKAQAWLLLGMSRYRIKNYHQAKQAFSKIAQHKHHGKVARQWISFIDNEVNRYEQLLGFERQHGET